MTKQDFLEDAIEILEDYKDGGDIHDAVADFLQRYYESLKPKPSKPTGLGPNPYITQQFEKAKLLVKAGRTIKFACEVTGLTRDQWNRRMKMQKEKNVRD